MHIIVRITKNNDSHNKNNYQKQINVTSKLIIRKFCEKKHSITVPQKNLALISYVFGKETATIYSV